MKTVIAFFLVCCCALVAYAHHVSQSLRGQAQDIAASRPFCVQVPGKDSYQAVGAAGDTLGLLMRGHGGYHHAVLVVGDVRTPDTYHWSYLHHRFIKGTYGPFPIVCRPRRDYLAHPDKALDADGARFTLAGRTIAIPAAYHGDPAWPGDLLGYSFLATAPGFLPADEFCSKRLCSMVHVAFRGGPSPEGMARPVAKEVRMLARRQSDGLISIPGRRSYIDVDDNGKVLTSIVCMESDSIQCLHVFTHGGLTYSFHHIPADLRQWRALQARLIALHERFEQASVAQAAAD
jgi:hypothetical protein